MLTPALQNLLILQDRDLHKTSIQSQLDSIPIEIAQIENTIATKKNSIEQARTELNSLESQKKLTEIDIQSHQATLAKYQTQQMQVKKNDEYQAIGHQIETTRQAIGDLEEKELKIMFAIDDARTRFKQTESEINQDIADARARIQILQDRAKTIAAELGSATQAVSSARQPITPAVLSLYDRIAAQKTPACVPLRHNTCSGCHLKVSGEIESAARAKQTDIPVTCDQCGRILWLDT